MIQTKMQGILTSINCNDVNEKNVSELFKNVDIINNAKKRISKNTEFYFQCGGGYDTESTTVLNDDKTPAYAFVYHVQIMINGIYLTARNINDITHFFKIVSDYLKTLHDTAKLIIWVSNLYQ